MFMCWRCSLFSASLMQTNDKETLCTTLSDNGSSVCMWNFYWRTSHLLDTGTESQSLKDHIWWMDDRPPDYHHHRHQQEQEIRNHFRGPTKIYNKNNKNKTTQLDRPSHPIRTFQPRSLRHMHREAQPRAPHKAAPGNRTASNKGGRIKWWLNGG